jgi:hypothetical protein
MGIRLKKLIYYKLMYFMKINRKDYFNEKTLLIGLYGMSCPQCKTQVVKGATWCKYCGEDITRSQYRMRYIYYGIIILVLAALVYFFVLPSFSIG